MKRTTYSSYTPHVGQQLSGHERVAIETVRSSWSQNTLMAGIGSAIMAANSTWLFEIDQGHHMNYIIQKVQIGCDRGSVVVKGYARQDVIDVTPTSTLRTPLMMAYLPKTIAKPDQPAAHTMYSLRQAPLFVTSPTANPLFVARVVSIGEGGARNSVEWELPTPIGLASGLGNNNTLMVKLTAGAVQTGMHIYVEWEEQLGDGGADEFQFEEL